MLELNTNKIFQGAKLLKYHGKTFYFIFFYIFALKLHKYAKNKGYFGIQKVTTRYCY